MNTSGRARLSGGLGLLHEPGLRRPFLFDVTIMSGCSSFVLMMPRLEKARFETVVGSREGCSPGTEVA